MSSITRGMLYLWIGMLIGSSASAIIAKLASVGMNHPIHGHNPISFCNVLFAGNVIAGICYYSMFYKQWTVKRLRPLSPMAWMCITVVALFGAVLAPTFYFFSLLLTSVNNVVLIATLHIPLSLLVGILFFKDRPNFLTYLGSFITLLGVVLIYLLTEQKADLSKEMIKINIGTGPMAILFSSIPQPGKLSAIAGTVFSVITVAVSRKSLQTVSIGIYLVFRMIMGTIIFFIIAMIMFGPHHFADLFSTFLWGWMLIYGGVVVAFGTFFRAKGIQMTTSSEIAIAKSFTPVGGVIFAYLIMREIPSQGQWIGGAVIVIGVFVSLFGKLNQKKMLEIEDPMKKPVGFTGV